MAASITGVFTIIDRASRPMERMERQALKTMAAIEALGKANDKLSASKHKGSAAWDKERASVNRMGRDLERTHRVMRDVEQTTRKTGTETEKLGGHTRNTSNRFEELANKLTKFNAVFRFFGSLISAARIPVLVAGLAAAAQGIGALAGGLTALLPALGRASGAIAALPGVVGAAVQGMGVFKLATSGVGDALKAGIQIQQQHTQVVQDSAEAHVQAVHAVQEAEYGLMISQRNIKDAQIQLTQARRDAVRNLTDLRFASEAADLAQQRASLNLRQAQRAVVVGALSPQSTDIDLASQQLGVREAQLQLRESRVTTRRARVDSHRANLRGVNRNLQVIAAQRGVTDAMHSERNAAFELASAQRALAREMQRGTGPISEFRQAMKNLSPPAQNFVNQLLRLYPAFKKIQAAAAEGLFPGLGRALTHVTAALPAAGRIANRTGRTIGDAAASAAARFTTPGRLHDLEGIAQMQDRVLNRMLRGAGNLAGALVDFMVAAKPFTDWLTHVIFQATEWISHWARAGRETGSFGKKLEGTKSTLKLFWDIAKNLFGTLRGIFRAASPLGDRLWKDFDKATRKWNDFTNDTKAGGGFQQMRSWFNKLHTPLTEFFGLLGDIAGAWARITVAGGLTEVLKTLRTGMPALESLFTKVAQAAPDVAKLLVDIVKVINDLPIEPLRIIVRFFDMIAKATDFLLRKVPLLGGLLSAALTATTLATGLKLVTKLFDKWKGLFGLFNRHRNDPPPSTDPGGPFGEEGPRSPGVPPTRRQRFRRGAARVAKGVGGLALFNAAMQGLTADGSFADRVHAALSGLTFGLLPGPQDPAQEAAAGQGAAATTLAGLTRRGGVRGSQERIRSIQQAMFGNAPFQNVRTGNAQEAASVARSQRLMRRIMRGDTGALAEFLPGKDNARERARVGALQEQITAERHGQRALQRSRVQQSVAHAKELASKMGATFRVYDKRFGPQKAMDMSVHDMLARMDNMKPEGRKVLAGGMLSWAREMAKKNPALKGEMDDLTRSIKAKFGSMGEHIRIVNGQILDGSKTEWRGIASALTDPMERAKERVKRGFTEIQEAAIGSLQSMGFTPSQARSLVRGQQAGGERGRVSRGIIAANQRHRGAIPVVPSAASETARHATGGRIAGMGLNDTVPLMLGMAAPGELIVNRHTEQRVRQKFGVDLGREVAQETRPHSAQPRNGINPGFARGGRVGNIQSMRTAASSIDAKRFPYLWGGGHNARFQGPYDCSGAVSAVLHAGGMLNTPVTSGQLMSMFAAGPGGPGGVTIYANPGHTYMQIGTRFFGTSTANPRGGAGWFNGGARPGFVQRHIPLGGRQSAGQAAFLRQLGDMAAFQQIGAPALNLPGVPGALAQQAVNIGTDAANAILSDAGAAGGAPGGLTTAGGRFNKGQLARLWTRAGGPSSAANVAAAIALAESGGNPSITNSIGAAGLWQIFGLPFPGNPLNALTNARMAVAKYHGAGNSFTPWTTFTGADTPGHERTFLRFMARGGRIPFPYESPTRYPTPGGFNYQHYLGQQRAAHEYRGPHHQVPPWGGGFPHSLLRRGHAPSIFHRAPSHPMGTEPFFGHRAERNAYGGRLPEWGGWHARGGTFNVTRPTLFGAGEAGPEKVTITRNTAGGGRDISVHIAKVEMHRPGDLKKAIHEELVALGSELDAADASDG